MTIMVSNIHNVYYEPGMVLSALQHYLIQFSKQLHEVGTIIFPVLQGRKMRHREMK